MTAEDLAQFRALLREQAAAPPAPRLVGRLRSLVGGGAGRGGAAPGPVVTRAVDVDAPCITALVASPPAPGSPLFGRREVEGAATATAALEPLLLTVAAEPPPGAAGRVRLSIRPEQTMRTPCLPEDLRDVAWSSRPTPGAIAGWSTTKPPSAQSRLLSRIQAVCEAERRGLDARLQAMAA